MLIIVLLYRMLPAFLCSLESLVIQYHLKVIHLSCFSTSFLYLFIVLRYCCSLFYIYLLINFNNFVASINPDTFFGFNTLLTDLLIKILISLFISTPPFLLLFSHFLLGCLATFLFHLRSTLQ